LTCCALGPRASLASAHTDDVINDAALDYMREHALAGTLVHRLATHEQRRFASKTAWMGHLEPLGLTDLQVTPDPVRVATEGGAGQEGSVGEADGRPAEIPCCGSSRKRGIRGRLECFLGADHGVGIDQQLASDGN